MANLLLPLVLAVTICVTLANYVVPNDNDFSCDYSHGQKPLPLSRDHFDLQYTMDKGSKSLNVTLPSNYGYPVSFVCVNIPDVDTETTDVSFSVNNDQSVAVLVTLDEDAQRGIIVDIRVTYVMYLI